MERGENVSLRILIQNKSTFGKPFNQSAIKTATVSARLDTIVALTAYMRSTPFIPRDTGRLVESGIASLKTSGSGTKFDLTVNFTVPYAIHVQEKTNFVSKIIPSLQRISELILKNSYDRANIKANVKVIAI